MENRQCSLEYAHASHQWYVELAEMGVVTYECQGKVVALKSQVSPGDSILA